MTTDPLSILSVRAEMKISSRREELIGFGVASAGASVCGLAAVASALSLFSTEAVVAHVFLGTLCALGALFVGRAAVRGYRTLLFKTMNDLNRMATLDLENQHFRGRIWDMYFSSHLAGAAAGESSGGSREGATLSPAANVYTLNSKRKEPFQ